MTTSPIAPTVGRIVILALANRSEECPGIVTRVYSNDCIDVCAFPPGENPWPVGSIMYADGATVGQNSWHWMDYQKQVAASQGAPASA